MNVDKPIPQVIITSPITIGGNSAMNQSEFLAITCNLLQGQEKLCAQREIGFHCFSLVYKLA